MRLLDLAACDFRSQHVEPGFAEQGAQGARRESWMALAVRGGDLALLVVVQREEDAPAARPKAST